MQRGARGWESHLGFVESMFAGLGISKAPTRSIDKGVMNVAMEFL